MTEPLRVTSGREPLRELTIDMRRVKPAVVKEVEQRLGEPLSAAGRKGREADIMWAFAFAVGRRGDRCHAHPGGGRPSYRRRWLRAEAAVAARFGLSLHEIREDLEAWEFEELLTIIREEAKR